MIAWHVRLPWSFKTLRPVRIVQSLNDDYVSIHFGESSGRYGFATFNGQRFHFRPNAITMCAGLAQPFRGGKSLYKFIHILRIHVFRTWVDGRFLIIFFLLPGFEVLF
jgi:hypothetical protein